MYVSMAGDKITVGSVLDAYAGCILFPPNRRDRAIVPNMDKCSVVSRARARARHAFAIKRGKCAAPLFARNWITYYN